MVREEIRYYCGVCDAYYMKKEKAEECENSHLIPKKVTKPVYSKQDKKEYPESVLIEFAGGKTARYYRSPIS